MNSSIGSGGPSHEAINLEAMTFAYRNNALDNFPQFLATLELDALMNRDLEPGKLLTSSEKDMFSKLCFYLEISNLMMRGKRTDAIDDVSPVRPAVYSRNKIADGGDGLPVDLVTASEAFRHFANRTLENVNGTKEFYPHMDALESGLADGSVQRNIYTKDSLERIRELQVLDQAEYIEDFQTIDWRNHTYITRKQWAGRIMTVKVDARTSQEYRKVKIDKSSKLPLDFHKFVEENKDQFIGALTRLCKPEERNNMVLLYSSLLHEAESADWLFNHGPFMMIVSENSKNMSEDLERIIYHASGMVEHIIQWTVTSEGFVDANWDKINPYVGREMNKVQHALTRMLNHWTGSYTMKFVPNGIPALEGKEWVYTTSNIGEAVPYVYQSRKMSFGIGVPSDIDMKFE